MADIAFEYLALALENVRGVKVTPPTHYANMQGMLSPRKERYRPQENRGTLAEFHRSKAVQQWAEWEATGPLDVDLMPVLLNMSVAPLTSPSTPTGATNTRLWAFVPTMNDDDLETASVYWGDPNVMVWSGAFGTIDTLTIASDASGTDGATMSVSGRTQKLVDEVAVTATTATISAATAAAPVVLTSTAHGLSDGDRIQISGVVGMTELNGRYFVVSESAANTMELRNEDGTDHTAYTSAGTITLMSTGPTLPSQTTGELIAGVDMQLWLDTSSAIGTTAITGRVVSAEHVIPVGYAYKFLAAGPGSSLTYTRVGRAVRSMVTTVVLELIDDAQINIFEADTSAKLRVRHNGPLIEGSWYNYVEVDTYGYFDFEDWGDLEGANRTVTLSITSEYDTTLSADFRVAVQNDNAAL